MAVLTREQKVIGTAIGSKVHGQDGLCWSHPRLVSPSELQCGEAKVAKVAVRPSRRPWQLCSAATERYLDQRRGTRDQRREPAKATARSRLHPIPMRGTWTLTDPGNSHARLVSTRPLAPTPTPPHHDRFTHICTKPSPLGTPEGLVHHIANPRTRALGSFKRDTIGNVFGLYIL